MRLADRRGGGDALEEARALRRLLEEGRAGASPEWVAAAEDALARAEQNARLAARGGREGEAGDRDPASIARIEGRRSRNAG